MHIVALGWMFVVVLMTLVEATSPQGSWLGAFFTLLLYGVLPLSIVLYVMGTPLRRQARRKGGSTAHRSAISPARWQQHGDR
jgi:predicted membrane channel-forming protein YqfA (hemolysin III family)